MFEGVVRPLPEYWNDTAIDHIALSAAPLELPDPAAWDWRAEDSLEQAALSPAGVRQLVNLLGVDPAALTADQAVTYAQQVERFAAYAAGLQARARAEAHNRLVALGEPGIGGECGTRAGSAFVTAHQVASAELAAALRVSPRTMDSQLQRAVELDGPMMPLRAAMLAGEMPAGHAAAIARELARAPLAGDSARESEFAALCSRILAVLVPYAARHTPGQCARRTRALVVAADPVGADQRRSAAAEREHGVWLTPTGSDTCELTAVMPIAHGRAVLEAITALAGSDHFATAPGCVTAGQRRVAALATLVLGDPGRVAAVDGPVAEAKLRASVSVVVPLSALESREGAGGVIAGEPATADALASLLEQASASSTLRRLVVDSAGCIIDAGRTRYAVSGAQRRLVALRDRTCRFPGCARPAQLCEVDHATPWEQGGPTDLANLGALCKHHHQLKTFGGWRITRSHASGACTWRSPLGRIYEHAPPGILAAPTFPEAPPPETPPPF